MILVSSELHLIKLGSPSEIRYSVVRFIQRVHVNENVGLLSISALCNSQKRKPTKGAIPFGVKLEDCANPPQAPGKKLQGLVLNTWGTHSILECNIKQW